MDARHGSAAEAGPAQGSGADKKRKADRFSAAEKRGSYHASEPELARGSAGLPRPGTLLCMQYDGVWYVVVVPDHEETEAVRF